MNQNITSALHVRRNETASAPASPSPALIPVKNGWTFSPVSPSPQTYLGSLTPIPYLHIFTLRVCVGTLEANGAGVKKRTAEVYLCDVA